MQKNFRRILELDYLCGGKQRSGHAALQSGQGLIRNSWANMREFLLFGRGREEGKLFVSAREPLETCYGQA